ncbi:ATP-binding cassette domain-containing protein [Nodularia spumigena]|uniref:ATP-binding cassette domain-containing protein n=1 Tax=Nodularia spumigena TaxID=70799 RepID=UPI0022B6B639|nr:ATP-binding cassette domain-containing protein [Nodularia spumigena]
MLTLNHHHPPINIHPQTLLHIENLHKSFILHQQGGVRLPVLEEISLTLNPAECVALSRASGSGKSTFMRCIYGNYRADSGSVWVKHEGHWLDLCQLLPHELLAVRQKPLDMSASFASNSQSTSPRSCRRTVVGFRRRSKSCFDQS